MGEAISKQAHALHGTRIKLIGQIRIAIDFVHLFGKPQVLLESWEDLTHWVRASSHMGQNNKADSPREQNRASLTVLGGRTGYI